ncbi:hypothetical protein IWQ60_001451 [Tieghemiomyces parasiticus]|uniref:Calcium-activated potassium channel BK alpha subunit domain-containing protein n=1 Tax=Tieghemiomyces parasiticus TaxID=78921 RepID=A0A9W8AGP9_9FUNG|nr:hypothetical protein IWQ60_001451 [Tieghemiomyces parasiticus]
MFTAYRPVVFPAYRILLDLVPAGILTFFYAIRLYFGRVRSSWITRAAMALSIGSVYVGTLLYYEFPSFRTEFMGVSYAAIGYVFRFYLLALAAKEALERVQQRTGWFDPPNQQLLSTVITLLAYWTGASATLQVLIYNIYGDPTPQFNFPDSMYFTLLCLINGPSDNLVPDNYAARVIVVLLILAVFLALPGEIDSITTAYRQRARQERPVKPAAESPAANAYICGYLTVTSVYSTLRLIMEGVGKPDDPGTVDGQRKPGSGIMPRITVVSETPLSDDLRQLLAQKEYRSTVNFVLRSSFDFVLLRELGLRDRDAFYVVTDYDTETPPEECDALCIAQALRIHKFMVLEDVGNVDLYVQVLLHESLYPLRNLLFCQVICLDDMLVNLLANNSAAPGYANLIYFISRPEFFQLSCTFIGLVREYELLSDQLLCHFPLSVALDTDPGLTIVWADKLLWDRHQQPRLRLGRFSSRSGTLTAMSPAPAPTGTTGSATDTNASTVPATPERSALVSRAAAAAVAPVSPSLPPPASPPAVPRSRSRRLTHTSPPGFLLNPRDHDPSREYQYVYLTSRPIALTNADLPTFTQMVSPLVGTFQRVRTEYDRVRGSAVKNGRLNSRIAQHTGTTGLRLAYPRNGGPTTSAAGGAVTAPTLRSHIVIYDLLDSTSRITIPLIRQLRVAHNDRQLPVVVVLAKACPEAETLKALPGVHVVIGTPYTERVVYAACLRTAKAVILLHGVYSVGPGLKRASEAAAVEAAVREWRPDIPIIKRFPSNILRDRTELIKEFDRYSLELVHEVWGPIVAGDVVFTDIFYFTMSQATLTGPGLGFMFPTETPNTSYWYQWPINCIIPTENDTAETETVPFVTIALALNRHDIRLVAVCKPYDTNRPVPGQRFARFTLILPRVFLEVPVTWNALVLIPRDRRPDDYLVPQHGL